MVVRLNPVQLRHELYKSQLHFKDYHFVLNAFQ